MKFGHGAPAALVTGRFRATVLRKITGFGGQTGASMTLKSMTGFARAAGENEALNWIWEVRSVNGKGLDARFRLPPGLESLEPEIRKALSARFRRGNFQISLQITRTGRGTNLRINRDFLDLLVEEARHLAARLGPGAAPASPAQLLHIRGVVDTEDDGARTRIADEHGEALLRSLSEAMDRLARAREEEGGRLEAVLREQIEEIARLVEEARNNPARTPEAIRERLREQLARIMDTGAEMDEDRLYQEAVLLAAKADVAEELDRLDSHVTAARELLEQDGPVGRRFEFLTQEFNREANTLCSKSNAASLTRTGLALKAVIDRLREQVANIE